MYSQPFIGQVYTSSVAFGSAVSLTTTQVANITSVVVPAGNYLVSGDVATVAGTGAAVTLYQVGVNSVSATIAFPGGGQYALTFTTAENQAFACPTRYISLPSGGTLYLSARANFSGGTVSAYGSLTAIKIG